MNSKQLAVVLCGILVGCGAPLEEEQETDELKTSGKTTATTSAYVLKTTDARVVGVTPTFNTSYVIGSTANLYLATDLPSTVKGHHTLTLFVYMPGQSVYQRFDVSFSTDVTPYAGEQKAEKLSTGYRVWVTLPVAGTIIEQYSLTGPWTGDVFLDMASVANAKTSFTLN
jgi:hypothetical protein